MPEKEKIRNLFDDIAPAYDKLNHLLSCHVDKGWRKKAVGELIDVCEPLAVLDVACGTGDLTIEIAKKAAPGSRIVGVDLSEEMMKAGRVKIADAGVDASMEQGDGEALVYSDGTFDRVSVGFGVRNFEHVGAGIKEMWRVLKPGGKLVVLELSVPSNAFARGCYKVYFLKVLPAIGARMSGNRGAYEYLPDSVLRFPAPERFMDMLREAGFGEVRHKAFAFGICRMYIGVKKTEVRDFDKGKDGKD